MDRVDLFWIPLGAGGFVVRRNGQLYEAWQARRQRRAPQPLFHAALEVTRGGHTFVIEMAPVWNLRVPDRGVVAEGPVGTARLGRWRAFRYEVRCWRDGLIPDVAYAVASPVRLTNDGATAGAIVALVPAVPPLTWGRDELGAGDMWNSNSLIAWLLSRAGLDAASIRPPSNGRAPGWLAGLTLASRTIRPAVEPSSAGG